MQPIIVNTNNGSGGDSNNLVLTQISAGDNLLYMQDIYNPTGAKLSYVQFTAETWVSESTANNTPFTPKMIGITEKSRVRLKVLCRASVSGTTLTLVPRIKKAGETTFADLTTYYEVEGYPMVSADDKTSTYIACDIDVEPNDTIAFRLNKSGGTGTTYGVVDSAGLFVAEKTSTSENIE